MTSARSTARATSYEAFHRDLKRRARGLPREVVNDRVEEAFRDLCRGLRPTLGLEVGAHEARFSRWLRSEVPGVRSVAFEANPYVHRKFADRLADAGVDYRQVAVSDADGPVELQIPRQLHNTRTDRRFTKHRGSRMASLSAHRWQVESERVPVRSVRLDDSVRIARDDVVVAWIDVEGANKQVLTSGCDVLARTSLLYVEVENEPVWDGQWLDVDVADFLAGFGMVPVLRDFQRPHQYNVVFAAAALADDPLVERVRDEVFRRP